MGAVASRGAELPHDLLSDELELLDNRPAHEILRWAFDRFGERVALVSSFQAEAMVLLDIAVRENPGVRVITVDTGRLPQETYDLIERVRRRYGVRTEAYFPDPSELEPMVQRHGVNLFYEDVGLRHMCCHVRKVRPLERALTGLDAWVTGLRRQHWATRAQIRKVELDADHGNILKMSPLADWTGEEVWSYIRERDVPYHPLYDHGYASIGCGPCTRPVPHGGDPRSGRWWWENGEPKECGIHRSPRRTTGEPEANVPVVTGS